MGTRNWVIGSFIVAAVAVICLGVYALSVKDSREQAKLEAELTDALARAESLGIPVYADHLRKNPIPDDQNAWVELKALYDLMDWEQGAPWQTLAGLYNEKDNAVLLATAQEPIAACAEMFRLAEAAADKPGYSPEREWESGVAMIAQDLSSAKALVRMLLTKSRYELHTGDPESSLASLGTAASIAAHYKAEQSNMSTLVFAALESYVAREVVGQAYVSDSVDHKAALETVLDGLFEEPDVKRHFIAEIVIFVESVRMASEENEAGNALREEIRPEDRPTILSQQDIPAAEALRFEVIAIEESCDYFEALTDDVAAFEDNDRLYFELTSLPFEWLTDGFPISYLGLYETLGGGTDLWGTGGPFWHLALRELRSEMYRTAFDIVTGSVHLDDGAKWQSVLLDVAEFEYLEYEDGFSITVTVPDHEPLTLKFDRPR